MWMKYKLNKVNITDLHYIKHITGETPILTTSCERFIFLSFCLLSSKVQKNTNLWIIYSQNQSYTYTLMHHVILCVALYCCGIRRFLNITATNKHATLTNITRFTILMFDVSIRCSSWPISAWLYALCFSCMIGCLDNVQVKRIHLWLWGISCTEIFFVEWMCVYCLISITFMLKISI